MKIYTVDELKEIFKESPYSSGHTMQFLKWLDQLSEEKECIDCKNSTGFQCQFHANMEGVAIIEQANYKNVLKPFAPQEKNEETKQEWWEGRLHFEIMEDYVLDAEMLNKKDGGKEAIMRGHYERLKSFIRQLLKEERGKVIEEIDSWLKKDSEGTWELEGLYMRFKDYLRKLKK